LINSQKKIWPKVTVIIVNWNGEHVLADCLAALTAQTVTPDKIIVVDNASSDASLLIVRRFPSVLLLAQNENLGFARGNNLALKAAASESEWIALLNPDAFPEPDWLERLLTKAKANPDFAAIGSRQMVYGTEGKVDGVGDVYHCSGLIWRNGYGRTQSMHNSLPSEIFSPCACAALYRREAIQSVGGFDEDYFCYVEDVDLGFRLRLAGHKAMYAPDAVVYHVGSATTGGQHSDFSLYHGHRNLVWTFIKNMPGILFWLFLPFHILLNIISVIYFSLLGKGKIILRAKRDAIQGVPKMWKKRKSIQHNRKASVNEIWRVLDKRLFPFRR
jgi:GT2 family glycosyltransferase